MRTLFSKPAVKFHLNQKNAKPGHTQRSAERPNQAEQERYSRNRFLNR